MPLFSIAFYIMLVLADLDELFEVFSDIFSTASSRPTGSAKIDADRTKRLRVALYLCSSSAESYHVLYADVLRFSLEEDLRDREASHLVTFGGLHSSGRSASFFLQARVPSQAVLQRPLNLKILF